MRLTIICFIIISSLYSFAGNTATLFNKSSEDSLAFNLKKSYEITKIDSTEGVIQRLFIVIDSSNTHNVELIQAIIIQVCGQYNLNENSNLSFFCAEKYADYKDILFFRDETEIDIATYKKWLNHYYLGEFDFRTGEYISYPANALGKVKSHSFIIKHSCA